LYFFKDYRDEKLKMVSQKRLKGHGNKGKGKEGVSKTTKYMGIFLLVVMIFSIGGFALIGTDFGSDGSSSDSQNFPLTEGAFQNSQTGEAYWGAIVNGEQFIFMNGIKGYDDFQNFASVATVIKTKDLVKIYVDEGFASDDALYLIEQKVFTALKIGYFRTNESTCDGSTLIFTNENKFGEGCLVFEAPKGEESAFADILAYHFIK